MVAFSQKVIKYIELSFLKYSAKIKNIYFQLTKFT